MFSHNFFFFSFKAFLFFFKAKIYKPIRSKGLINYWENAAYYNTIPSLSMKEDKIKKNTHINKQKENIQTYKHSNVFTIIAKSPIVNV